MPHHDPDEVCSKCIYGQEIEGLSGGYTHECRFYPKHANEHGNWPHVKADDWCREFKKYS